MNFEKVELYGFKSFADKAEIKFGNGITGIVGPNGCGKSNVADAIRWVLGEQSAKSLRGSNMQDVIFSGTQNRKSLSYCEVSLFFDNTNRMFSLDYNEIIITRKLYRSGESEYFINKQPSRLKDIVDLLHECGIGKEGYSIIGQGKVEEIMSAKPEDRRLIFEEATGIAKFKSRKNESERKLERTRENITRYSDILSEIENQLGPLEKQAEKAKEFNELSEQLKITEINTYIAKADGVGSAKEKITHRINGLEQESALRVAEAQKASQEYDKIFEEINQADAKLRKLNDELLEKRVSMEKSSGAKQLFEQKISYLMSQIEKAKTDITNNVGLIEQCNSTLNAYNEEKEQLTKELEQLVNKSEQLKDKILKLSNKLTIGEELASANRKKIIESLESLSDFKTSKGTLSVEKNNLVEKLQELDKKIEELSKKRNDILDEKEKSDRKIDELDRAVFDLKNKISQKEEEVRQGNEDVATCSNKIYSLNATITSLVTKDNFYRALKENYEGYSSSVKLLLNKAKENGELKKRIKGVVAELIKSDKKFDIALETALAAAAQNVVTATPDDARYLIEYLKTNKFGRITFLPVSSVKPRTQTIEVERALNEIGVLGVADKLVSYDEQYKNVISNLLGNTIIVDNIDNATKIAQKYHFSFKMVTLDGDVFSTQGAMSGGSRRTDVVGLLSSDRRLQDNVKQLEEKRSEMLSLKAKQEELEIKRDKSLDELGLLNDVYNGRRQELLLEREKQAISEKALSEAEREVESLSEITDSVRSKLEQLTRDYENVTSGGKLLEEQKSVATQSADKHQAEHDALRIEHDKLNQENTDIQVKVTSLKARISAITNDSERLSLAVKEAEQSNIRLEKSNEGALQIIEELRLEQEKVALSKQEQEYINGIRNKIDNIETYKTQLRTQLNKNGELKEKLNAEITELSEKKHLEELALSKIDSDLEYMGQSIYEDYQETYETALRFKLENFDAVQGEAEIGRLRRKRSALGAINATAIEDCKVLKERFEEMTMQKQDLEKAEEDLKQAIDKIKGEMLSQFDEGFCKINENFQRIFKELFGGGRAMLEIDYSQVEDRLEAGIEIVAEPPGKKLQKLSLLSGGEKALTAIAILFSILKLRPMPFCVLDEIEAALDEANVDRFARYLKKFSQETQFIVITHRKPTMELADALFGVTMQEKGISKMVSVKLSDVADLDTENIV